MPPEEIFALGVYRLGHHRNSYVSMEPSVNDIHYYRRKNFENFEIVRDYNREIELNRRTELPARIVFHVTLTSVYS